MNKIEFIASVMQLCLLIENGTLLESEFEKKPISKVKETDQLRKIQREVALMEKISMITPEEYYNQGASISKMAKVSYDDLPLQNRMNYVRDVVMYLRAKKIYEKLYGGVINNG